MGIIVKRVLVLNIGGIGDMVMATPSLDVISKNVEDKTFDLLTTKRSSTVIEKAVFIRKIYTIDVSLLTGRVSIKSLILFFTSIFTLLRLRLRRYELAVDLMAVESPAAARRRRFLLALISPFRCAGRNTNGWAGYLDVGAGEELLSDVHEVERKLSVTKALGMDYAGEKMTVFTTPSDREAARSLLRSIVETRGEHKRDIKGFSVLIPGAYRPTRRWNREGFISVGRYLTDRFGLGVLVFGISDEGEIISHVTENIPGAIAVYDTEPRAMFEVFRECDIIVTNDTGPMHIAAAAESPGIVSIFGPENHNRYAPYGKGLKAEVIFGGADCSPCTLFECDKMDCMKDIGPEVVKEAIDRLMEWG